MTVFWIIKVKKLISEKIKPLEEEYTKSPKAVYSELNVKLNSFFFSNSHVNLSFKFDLNRKINFKRALTLACTLFKQQLKFFYSLLNIKYQLPKGKLFPETESVYKTYKFECKANWVVTHLLEQTLSRREQKKKAFMFKFRI